MKRVILSIMLCLPLPGCSWVAAPAYTKTVAVLPFSAAAGKSAGHEAADHLGIELLAKGYVVIDSSTTKALISEGKFYNSGINDDMRKALQARSITSVLFGSINDYGCEAVRSTALISGLPGSQEKNFRCSVSLTAKMADTATGRLLWGVTLADSSEGANLTAAELMKAMIRKARIGDSLPEPVVEETKNKWTALLP